MPETITLDALPAPRFHYSQMIRAGDTIYCSGLLGISDAGELAEGGPGAEAASILERVPAMLEELGLDWQHLVSARIYCTDLGRFAEVNQAWEALFTDGRRPPARTSIGVAGLPLGASVEIEFLLYCGQG